MAVTIENMKDSFDQLDVRQDKLLIQEVVSMFHYRNGTRNPDGSMGEIRITPKQLRDALACVGIQF